MENHLNYIICVCLHNQFYAAVMAQPWFSHPFVRCFNHCPPWTKLFSPPLLQSTLDCCTKSTFSPDKQTVPLNKLTFNYNLMGPTPFKLVMLATFLSSWGWVTKRLEKKEGEVHPHMRTLENPSPVNIFSIWTALSLEEIDSQQISRHVVSVKEEQTTANNGSKQRKKGS